MKTPTPTPLPELEAQLTAAARRLDAAVPRRRWWRHGWALLSIFVVAAGASVAVARVAEVGPFSYMANGIARGENPKLAPVSVITVQPPGDAPSWQARAYLNGLDQLCITGGPRDPRTNPDAKPTASSPNNAPQNGVTCADDNEIAEALVDPDWPGATFAASSDLDGALQGRRGRIDARGNMVPIDDEPATRVLVYAIASADGPRPVVRWGAKGEPLTMQASTGRLRMTVDKSPDGLSPAERRQVGRYPDELDLVLWAADVEIPDGAKDPQVVFPAEFPPHGVDDATVEMLGTDEIYALIKRGERTGWKYRRHITRDARPVTGPSDAQRRWIAGFARDRAAGDRVPRQLRTDQAAFYRLAYGASRKLAVAGGGLDDIWIAPGALQEAMVASHGKSNVVCLLGAAVLRQCKNGTSKWREPFVEAVACAHRPDGGRETLVWALTPPGMTRVTLKARSGRVTELAAGELLAVRRPVVERIERITWTGPDERRVAVRVPWPDGAPPRCDAQRPAGTVTRRDNAGTFEMTGPPPSARPKP